ncbi:MAG: hypothetical protein F6J93_29580 [Oscillatoria sp. SIO1A7]|nr:hypothetical protein [Oscillatoria sp. SIO1A7]
MFNRFKKIELPVGRASRLSQAEILRPILYEAARNNDLIHRSATVRALVLSLSKLTQSWTNPGAAPRTKPYIYN